MIMNSDLQIQILNELGGLTPDAQQRVLNYVHSLKKLGRGMSAETLRKHAGCLDPEEARRMSEAIEEGCGPRNP